MQFIPTPNNIEIVRYFEHPMRIVDAKYYTFVNGHNPRSAILFYLRVYTDGIDVSIDYIQNSVIFGDIVDGDSVDGKLYETHGIGLCTPIVIRLTDITIISPFMNYTLKTLLTSLRIEVIDGRIHAIFNDIHCHANKLIIDNSSIFGVNLFELMKERGILTINY